MSTYIPSGKGLADGRKWFVVDASGKTVGRLATEVARILSGKNNPAWTPFLDMGDHVIVINAREAIFKGTKTTKKFTGITRCFPADFAKFPSRKCLSVTRKE